MSLTQTAAAEAFMSGGPARIKAGYLNALARGFFGGMLLSLGGIVALIIGGGIPLSTYPGVVKLATAAVFPIGIVSVILTGSDLVTANLAIFFISTMKGKTTILQYLANVTVVFGGNLAGSIFTAGILGYYTGIFPAGSSFHSWVITFATAKVVAPTFGMVVARGIGCNLLVCLAVYQAALAQDILSKIVAIYLPIFLFVACGFDHVVANMLFIPLALFLQAPGLSVGSYIVRSMIPSLIGNWVGAIMLALPITYFHLMAPADVADDMETGSVKTLN